MNIIKNIMKESSYTKLYKIYKCNYKLTLLTLNLAYNSNDK